MTESINKKLLQNFEKLSKQWDNDIIPTLEKYIEIPNKSVAFDPNWKKNGYMDKAMKLIVDWTKKQSIQNMKVELLESENRTPLLFIEIDGQSNETILLYGHMDKQPEMKGWDKDLGPWKPVIKNNRLYGRGGADDGYSLFSSLSAIQFLQDHKIPHARCVIIIEACEESGSEDLPYYLEKIKHKIGTPNFVICLDSECGNYDQLWSSTSIRGNIKGTLKIEVLTEGIHSGSGSGIVPSTMMILRQLLDRIENKETGEFLLDAFKVTIPESRIKQAKEAAVSLNKAFYEAIPFKENTEPVTHDVKELILNKTWRAALSVVGADGFPNIQNAGNVTLPDIEVKLSVRTPPTCNAEKAGDSLKKILEENPPYGAKVSFEITDCGGGWHAPELADWLAIASDEASKTIFNKSAAYLGVGGSIPFMGMLGEMYPDAQFLITGVLGPHSNAHGPNEFLDIPYVKKITFCVASVIAAHYGRK